MPAAACVATIESSLVGISVVVVTAVREVIPLLPPPLPPTLPLADELLLDEYDKLLCWFVGSTADDDVSVEFPGNVVADDMLSE